MDDAQDSVLRRSNQQVIQMPAIPTVDVLPLSLDERRVNQQTLLPTSVKARLLGEIMSSTTPTPSTSPTQSGVVSLATGTTRSFLFTISDTQGRAIVALPEVTIYTGGVDSSTPYPNTTYNLLTMPVAVYNDHVLSSGPRIVTRVLVANSSGADALVNVVCAWRVITQPNPTLSSALVNTSVSVVPN